ncbi:hypothetical protein [Burkholderia diffusa]
MNALHRQPELAQLILCSCT